ncbi:MAG: DUF5711 family protein [Lachnospiraceae bacterium]|nr:DUF5711 family protein [Lachnospiraceae bacterium]
MKGNREKNPDNLIDKNGSKDSGEMYVVSEDYGDVEESEKSYEELLDDDEDSGSDVPVERDKGRSKDKVSRDGSFDEESGNEFSEDEPEDETVDGDFEDEPGDETVDGVFEDENGVRYETISDYGDDNGKDNRRAAEDFEEESDEEDLDEAEESKYYGSDGDDYIVDDEYGDDDDDTESMEEYVERHIKRRKIIRIIVICLVCALVIFVAVIVGLYYYGYEYKGISSEKSIKREDSNTVVYESYDEKLVKYSRDGMAIIGKDGRQEFNVSFDMVNPHIDICGSCIVVADVGGKSVCVYDGKNKTKVINTDFNVLSAVISSKGVTAVLMEDTASNIIKIYKPFDATNNLVAEIPTNVDSGYPVSMDISPDSETVVTSYVSITNQNVVSKLTFYNFSDIGQNVNNNMVGNKEYEDRLIADVRFVDSDNLISFDDTGFTYWENMGSPKEKFSVKTKHDMNSVMFNIDYIGYIEKYGKNNDQYMLHVYDSKGKRLLSKKVDFEYQNAMLHDKEVIVYSGGKCEIFRVNGTKKLSYKTDGHLKYFLPGEGLRNYYVINETKINLVKLKILP